MSSSTIVRSRACAFSKTTLWSFRSWPMVSKCFFTLSPIGITRSSAPSCSAIVMALFFVRSVVPKQGMVTATMFLRGSEQRSMALAQASMTSVESTPPETPITGRQQFVYCMRLMRPSAWMVRQRSANSPRSPSGTKGSRFMRRVSAVSACSSSQKQWSAPRQLIPS